MTQWRQFKQCCVLFCKQSTTLIEFHGSFGQAVNKIMMYRQNFGDAAVKSCACCYQFHRDWGWFPKSELKVCANLQSSGFRACGFCSAFPTRLSCQVLCARTGDEEQPTAICLSSVPGELCSPLDQGLLVALDPLLSSLPGIQTLQVKLVE